jgi:perosamine synthetase
VIPIARTYIGPEEQEAVAEVLASGWLAAHARVPAFEAAFAAYVSSPKGVACSSGTSGLCVAMKALDLPRGSTVLATPFSFIASANCIDYGGGVPVFADVDADTFMLSAATVEAAFAKDPSIKAVVPVHLYGQAGEIHEIVRIAHHYGAAVIEDCAQSHGASENGAMVGAIGDLGVFSFYPTKNMTTGEGGIITGANEALLDRSRLIVDQGAPVRYHHTIIGYNYRMTEIAAAIGLTQFARLPKWNEQRRANAHTLSAALCDLPWLTVPYERPDCIHVFHQYVLKVPQREALMAHLKDAGVGTAVHYPITIPDQPVYRDMGYNGADYPVAQQLAREVLSLPVHPALSAEDVQTIIAAVRSFKG